jgi:hypothetical protein
MNSPSRPLYRPHELAFRTQYAELKDRARSSAALLPGTPGSLVKRAGTGRAYWYRVYQVASGTQVEDLLCKEGDYTALVDAQASVEFAQWMSAQVRNLRRLEFQVADKGVASVLVALHNRGLFAAGLAVVGTLGYMAWLNELGARAVSARTQDIDLAARQGLKLAAPQSFLETVQATRLGFVPVPGMLHDEPSTSVKRQGSDGLRIDVLAHGDKLGASTPIAELAWHAQTVPHFDYLLADPREAAILAGGHCVPVLLPQPERFVWHKLYSSASRRSFPEKATKDLQQAATLAAVLAEQDDAPLADSFDDVPSAMKQVIRKRLPAALRMLGGHVDTQQALESLQP